MNPPKSKKELQESGTFRSDRHEGRLEDKVKLLEIIPKPPASFDKRHRDKWADVCKNVFDLGVLTENDLDSIEVYVKYWFIAKDAWDDIKASGYNIPTEKGGLQRNPSIITMNEATKITQQIADKFAGNPRSRMVIKTSKQESKEEDPLDNLN